MNNLILSFINFIDHHPVEWMGVTVIFYSHV